MTKTMTARQILNAAARRIEQYGWVRGCFIYDKKCCAVGAMNLITTGAAVLLPGEKSPNRSALRAAHDAVLQEISPYDSIFNWNDAPDQTKTNVIATLRRAARRMKSTL